MLKIFCRWCDTTIMECTKYDTLGLFISLLIIKVYLIIQISLQVHAKAHALWAMTKCVDYAGVLIFKYPA